MGCQNVLRIRRVDAVSSLGLPLDTACVWGTAPHARVGGCSTREQTDGILAPHSQEQNLFSPRAAGRATIPRDCERRTHYQRLPLLVRGAAKDETAAALQRDQILFGSRGEWGLMSWGLA